MGQKINPVGFRLGINRTWNSFWFTDSNYSDLLHQDLLIRKYIDTIFLKEGFFVSRCLITRPLKRRIFIRVDVYSDSLGNNKTLNNNISSNEIVSNLSAFTGCKVYVVVKTMSNLFDSAKLVCTHITKELERRNSFNKITNLLVKQVSNLPNVKGLKISCSGRLGRAMMARTEWVKHGTIPLHTLTSNIDYFAGNAYTKYGVFGVKVWLCFKEENS